MVLVVEDPAAGRAQVYCKRAATHEAAYLRAFEPVVHTLQGFLQEDTVQRQLDVEFFGIGGAGTCPAE